MKLVTAAQMRSLEQAAVDAGATWSSLMEQAGWGVAQVATQMFGIVKGRSVVVLVGPGNNGGDGLVVARHLYDAGAHVTLYIWRRTNINTDRNWQLCRERDIVEYDAESDPQAQELQKLLGSVDMVIDALLGMGVNRPVTGELATILTVIESVWQQNIDQEEARRPLILAIDVPTGIDSDSGKILGQAIHVDATAATGLVKRGLLQQPGYVYTGALHVVDIGLTSAQLEGVMSETISVERARKLVPARPDDSHKGTFGKAMIVAGSLLYPGAASLATAGAARVGAGLVTLATGRSVLGGPGRLPEITWRPLPEAGGGVLMAESANELLKHLEDYQALLVGPGIGQEEETEKFLARLLGVETQKQRGQIGFRITSETETTEEKQTELPPTVLDADALNILSKLEGWFERLPRGHCILTPHPGEMKRLLDVEELASDTIQVAEDAAKRWGQIVVLKGTTTVVADPDGQTMVNGEGNAALATAGTGDVLAGAIVGLLAQGVSLFDAAVLGVYLHSAAGQLVREEIGSAGALASDLLPRLPLVIKRLHEHKK